MDPGDAGWGRLMDALVLIVQHPNPSGRGPKDRQADEPG
jgi:hypothetical protein